MNTDNLDPSVWGSAYWDFVHTTALTYPEHPQNDAIKKVYYNLVQNLHLFIPHIESRKYMQYMLNQYPVQPYLDSRQSFVQWSVFIHNKVNEKLEKPKITVSQFYEIMSKRYTPKHKQFLTPRTKKNMAYFVIIGTLIYIAYTYSKK